jgi:riboflavin synthase
MFTGLVEDSGEIMAVTPAQGGRELRIRTRIPMADVAIGDSIAVDGVCLTVESTKGDTFTATAGRETLERSSLSDARAGRRVHLERALQLGARLGGHLVQGHVDCTGKVVESRSAGESWVLWIDLPANEARYVAAKGSICIDGISLTVNEVRDTRFRVNIVPHTSEVTTITRRAPGDRVNIEVDILAKYVERLLSRPEPGKEGLSLETLIRNGFA